MGPGRDPHGDRLRAAARAMGVTRVARLTGLDRTGVEVASAVRPLGHVLQVTNGKGARFQDASFGALMEAAELYASERPACEAWASARDLARRLGEAAVLSPRTLEATGEPSWDQLRLAWRSGVDLSAGREVLVPACAVHVPPPGAAAPGPAPLRWTSSGMGAALRREDALRHALLEAVERDRLARALPEGFTEGEVAARLLDPRSLARAAPRVAELAARIERNGFRVYLFDVSTSKEPAARPQRQSRPVPFPAAAPGMPRPPFAPSAAPPQAARSRGARSRSPPPTSRRPPATLGVPCAAALIVDHDLGPVPVAAGYSCRLRRDAALVAALLEAAQSRATEIHGAREDVVFGDRHASVALARLCAATRPRRDAGRMPDLSVRTARAGAAIVLALLRRAGFGRVVAVDLEGPPGVAVVKVLVPGLLLSELL